MTYCKFLIAILAVFFLPMVNASQLLLTDSATLVKVKNVMQKTDDKSSFAFNSLIRSADKDLTMPLLSVTDSAALLPSGSNSDYYSVGPYWWPNEETDDGLPWIRKDGEINPVPRQKNADNVMFYQLAVVSHRLALAYFFTDETKYSDKLSNLIEHWFVNPSSAMNPNLNFAQGVPGVAKGRPYGIIEFRHLIQILDSITLTKKHLDPEVLSGFNKWLEQFWVWLSSSELGTLTAALKNNHGTFYDTLIVGIGLYSNKPEAVKKALQRSKDRIVSHIEPDGSQPLELARTRPYHYSAFNHQAFSRLAVMAEKVNIDLWNYPSQNDRRIIQSFVFLIDEKNTSKIWSDKPSQKKLEQLVSPAFRIGQRFAVDLKPVYQHETSHKEISMCSMLFGISVNNADKIVGSRQYDCKL